MSWKIALLVAALLAVATGTLLAQTDRGTIEGIITDPTGAAVPFVRVQIVRVQTKDTIELTTNDGGRYFAPNLPSGTYQVLAQKEGFHTARVEEIQIQSQGSVRMDITLTLGSVTEAVEVSAQGICGARQYSRYGKPHLHEPELELVAAAASDY